MDDVPGMRSRLGGAPQQPGECDLHGRCLQRGRRRVERRGLQRRESAEREERHVGGALGGQVVNERVVAAVSQVVEVLDAGRWR